MSTLFATFFVCTIYIETSWTSLLTFQRKLFLAYSSHELRKCSTRKKNKWSYNTEIAVVPPPRPTCTPLCKENGLNGVQMMPRR